LHIAAIIRYPLSLQAIGIFHDIFMSAKHVVGRQIKRVEETVKGVFMALKLAIGENMLDFKAKRL